MWFRVVLALAVFAVLGLLWMLVFGAGARRAGGGGK